MYTEYRLEVNRISDNKLLKEIAVFDSYEEAIKAKENAPILPCKEYYNIIYVEYDEDGEELSFGSVV